MSGAALWQYGKKTKENRGLRRYRGLFAYFEPLRDEFFFNSKLPSFSSVKIWS